MSASDLPKSDYTAEAAALIAHGISVGPLRTDGSKLPAIRWKDFQNRHMTAEEVERHFADCGGVFAITGKVSRLFLFDFDLKYDYEAANTYAAFMEQVPEALKTKFKINRTRSGGMHIWVRTDYTDRSRKITRRELTLSEFEAKVYSIMSEGANELTAMRLALKAPFQCTLETRGEGSYGVILHPSYEAVQSAVGTVTPDEMELLLSIGYGLDCGFRRRERVFVGERAMYKEIVQFNEDCGAEGTVRMLEMSGLYRSIGTDYNGNYRMSRIGSASSHSGYVYADSGVFKIFGTNLFDSDKDTLSPFDIYRLLNDLSEEEAVKTIIEKRSLSRH